MRGVSQAINKDDLANVVNNRVPMSGDVNQPSDMKYRMQGQPVQMLGTNATPPMNGLPRDPQRQTLFRNFDPVQFESGAVAMNRGSDERIAPTSPTTMRPGPMGGGHMSAPVAQPASSPYGGNMQPITENTDYSQMGGGRPMPAPNPMASGGIGYGQPEPEPTALERNRNKIEYLDAGGPATSYKHEGNPAKRMFRGMGNGWKDWEEGGMQGGLLGGILSMFTKGVGESASPDFARKQGAKRERSKLFREQNYLMQQDAFDMKQAQGQAQIANYGSQINNRAANTIMTRNKNEQAAVWDEWNANKTFKRSDPQHRALMVRAQAAGINLPDKEEKETWKRFVDPDGTVGYYNDEGEEKVTGNRAKAKDFKDDDVSDAEFGLYDDKQIENMATASIAPTVKGRQVRPNVLAALPAKYKNTDGSFNETAYLTDLSKGNTELNSSEVYEDLPSNEKQRVAAEIERIRGSQNGLRKQLTRFRSILNHRTPNPNSPAVTLDQVKQWFKEALNNKDNPKEKLEQFYKVLQSANIK